MAGRLALCLVVLLLAGVAEGTYGHPMLWFHKHHRLTHRSWCRFSRQLVGDVLLRDAVCPGTRLNYKEVNAKGLLHCQKVTPAVIVAAGSSRDVAHAVHFARRHGLQFRVRSGGHSIMCSGVCEECMVIDLGQLNHTARIPTPDGQMYLDIEAGATLRDLFFAYQGTGRFIPHGTDGTVGIGGHASGGGVGWMAREYGLTTDYVVGVEIVLSTGSRVRIFDPEHEERITGRGPTLESVQNQDLLWAVRGSGHGSFGIITRYWFRTLAQPGWIVASSAEWTIPKSDAVHYFKAFCTYYSAEREGGSRNLTVWPLFNPGSSGKLAFRMSYTTGARNGPQAIAEAMPVLQGFLSLVPGGEVDLLSTYPVPFDHYYYGLMTYQPRINYDCISRAVMREADLCANETYLTEMANELYDESLSSNFVPTGHMMFTYMEPWGGAIPEADPCNQRTSFGIRHTWANFQYCRMSLDENTPPPNPTPFLSKWNSRVERFSNHSYLNYPDQFVASYSRLYPDPLIFRRLQYIKTRYDPQDVFNWAWSVPVYNTEGHRPHYH